MRQWQLDTRSWVLDRRRILTTRRYASSHPTSESNSTSQHVWPSTSDPTPYEIFDLHTSASIHEVKKRYYELVKIYHPDYARSGYHPEKFRSLVEANYILSHPGRRRAWDRAHGNKVASAAARRTSTAEYGSRRRRMNTDPYQHHQPQHHAHATAATSGISRSRVRNDHFNYDEHFGRHYRYEMQRNEASTSRLHEKAERDRAASNSVDENWAKHFIAISVTIGVVVWMALPFTMR